jgi:DNA polymerase, archaea type
VTHSIDHIDAFYYLKDYVSGGVKLVESSEEAITLEDDGDLFVIKLQQFSIGQRVMISNWVSSATSRNLPIAEMIYGSSLENIVSVEPSDNKLLIYTEKDGVISCHEEPLSLWILAPRRLDSNFEKLNGSQFYKWMACYTSVSAYQEARKKYYLCNVLAFADLKEVALIGSRHTYYKGLNPQDVSVLSFDIETSGLTLDKKSTVFCISNVFRSRLGTEEMLFSLENYRSQKEMIADWVEYVKTLDPSVLIGHNIFGFDLAYLDHCSRGGLGLGRDGSNLIFARKESQFRKDGSQSYGYKRAFVHGREIVDTMFLAYHYDVGRKYESYGLKSIIESEGLTSQDRVFYDASKIAEDWHFDYRRELIKQYALDDTRDALKLYDLMIPSYHYLTRVIPKSFQSVNYTATGSQLNAFLIRSYLAINHSIPKTSDAVAYEGALSHGFPGVYKNVFKVDVASLYPNIMLSDCVFDRNKDPKRHFLRMVEVFTKERLENKRLSKKTGNRMYRDLEQSQKIVINSAYGLLGARGLHFNSPQNAALVTERGREILSKAIEWAKSEGYTLVNYDTDSISIASSTPFDTKAVLERLNSGYPDKIRFEDDGLYDAVLVLKAKNYVMKSDTKTFFKGSSLKSSKTEPIINEMMKKIISALLEGQDEAECVRIYQTYVRLACSLTDIKAWCSKKTITSKVLAAERTTEKKLLEALEGKHVQAGDKVWVYFKSDHSLGLAEDWKQDHSVSHFLKRLHSSVKIFDTVLKVDKFTNYSLKKNQKSLDYLLNG